MHTQLLNCAELACYVDSPKGVAVRGAAGDEMTPSARVRSLLNRLSLSGESAPERPGIDRLAERELLGEALSVAPRHG